MDKDKNGNVTEEEFKHALSNTNNIVTWMTHIIPDRSFSHKPDFFAHLPFYVHNNMTVCCYNRMIEWSNDQMIEWLNDWMIEWFIDWMIEWLNDSLIDHLQSGDRGDEYSFLRGSSGE